MKKLPFFFFTGSKPNRKGFENKVFLLALLSGQHREVRQLLKEGNVPNPCGEDGISLS